MMLFNSFFLLSLIFFVLDSCRPSVAATLAVSPVKRGRLFDALDCSRWLPDYIPSDFPRFPNLQAMCASKEQHPKNLECTCIGEKLLCGSSKRPDVQLLINWCYEYCVCGPETKVIEDRFIKELNYGGFLAPIEMGNTLPEVVNPWARHNPNRPAGSSSVGSHRGHTCAKRCSNINHDCDRFFEGDCKCYAPPVSSLFWHSGDCGPVPHSPKRDLAQQRLSHYLNATAQYARPSKAAAPPGPPPDLAAQLASGLLPSPCNASYVSFACSDSKDGIVHEPPQNWLGDLLPENAKELPPVPKEFLRIHHEKDGKMRVLRPAMDQGDSGFVLEDASE